MSGFYSSMIWPSHTLGRVRSVAIALTTCYVVKKVIDRVNRKYKFDVSKFSAPPRQILLHQFQRGLYCPNLSPFALKVETFLRISGIPYTVDSTVPFGPKGKCPWVNMEDGTPVGDSQMILDALTNLEKGRPSGAVRLPKIDDNLSDKEKASLEGMVTIVEEQLFWCVIYYRYYLDGCKVFLSTQKFPAFLHITFPLFMSRGIKQKCTMQGIGCHEPEEVLLIARKCCKTLSDYLGSSLYFCGDNPGTADCAIFGGLSQIMWNAPGTEYEALVKDEFPNLSKYCTRMQQKVYPDWEKLLVK